MTALHTDPGLDPRDRAIEELRRSLDEALAREQRLLAEQGALSAILHSMGESPADLLIALDEIAESAARLCGAPFAGIQQLEDGRLRMLASHGRLPGVAHDGPWRDPPGGGTLALRTTASGRALLERRTIHTPDMAAAVEREFPDSRAAQQQFGFRTTLGVPLLREGRAIGVIAVLRFEVRPFSEPEIALLETFAAQAAIAIAHARLFQELAEKSRQLEEASRHKSEFLAHMSHELRTPLNAIIGFTEVLLERYFGEVNEKQAEYLRDVLSSGQHLLALITDILDLSKVEAGRMELELGTFALEHVLGAGLVMVKERAARRGVELSLRLAEDVGAVEADERKVKQVLFNLLANAVKFTPDGGQITVSARRYEGHVEVAVADTGVGIAAEDLPRIFEEFGQARNQAGQTEGTGLGLVLCKRLVELHGGSIRVESQPGRGSTFSFVLPVRQPARA